MPFWKQSEDPWDRKPGKRRPEPKDAKEPQANPLDSLKQWNDGRRAKAKEKEEAKWLPPEKCPWCGKDMEQGFLVGGRDGTHWYPGIYKFEPFRGLSGEAIDVLDDSSGFASYKVTWLCRECQKAVFTMPEPASDYVPFAAPAETEETQEEETSEE